MFSTPFNRSVIARGLICLALLAGVLLPALTAAAKPADIIVVTTNADSGAGSLRNAILQANSNGASVDTINFNISGSAVIALLTPLPTITNPVIIDGLTQPGSACTSSALTLHVVLAGQGAGIGAIGLDVTANGATIQGLVIQRFANHAIWLRTAGGNTVRCNIIGLNSTGSSGSIYGNGGAGVYVQNVLSNTITRNIISNNTLGGIVLSGGNSGADIKSNYIGTDITGATAIGNGVAGIRLNGPAGSIIGGANASDGNLISGNNGMGIALETSVTAATKIWNNKIGLGANGEHLGNTSYGIYVSESPVNQIGSAGMGNQIGNNGQEGIFISGVSATGNKIQGNAVGVDFATASNHGNSFFGIQISGAPKTLVGGSIPEEGNWIAYNAADGVYVSGTQTGNTITGNLIYNNQGLAIDLGNNGVDANDAGDSDSGANNLQNFPLLRAIYHGSSVFVFGQLNSLPDQKYRVEIFSNTACDPAGNGEAQYFGTAIEVTTDAAGDATFSAALANIAPTNRKVTASATDAAGNTSELSACVNATPAKALFLAVVQK